MLMKCCYFHTFHLNKKWKAWIKKRLFFSIFPYQFTHVPRYVCLTISLYSLGLIWLFIVKYITIHLYTQNRVNKMMFLERLYKVDVKKNLWNSSKVLICYCYPHLNNCLKVKLKTKVWRRISPNEDSRKSSLNHKLKNVLLYVKEGMVLI